jgi:hypothetical protein
MKNAPCFTAEGDQNKLEELGCDSIEKIRFICFPDHKQPGHFNGFVEVQYPPTQLYVMPDMDEEQERYHDWDFR